MKKPQAAPDRRLSQIFPDLIGSHQEFLLEIPGRRKALGFDSP
jgi:hypothetical protein